MSPYLMLRTLLFLSISAPVYHSWQLLVVKSSIQTVERAGLLDQLSGRGNDVTNQSGIISVVSGTAFLSLNYCTVQSRVTFVVTTVSDFFFLISNFQVNCVFILN